CAQVERIDELIARKQAILHRYRELLHDCRGCKLNDEQAGAVIGAWMPNLVFDPETKVTSECLQAAFAADNIDARVFFYPLSSLPMFGSQRGAKESADIMSRSINLPSYHDMTDEEQQRVVQLVRGVLHG
ncbi:MAG: DegT/DnrJ/EryC1/StrS family aminotransferase, partial [Undibacterium sp.]|nr:DegT/DnrJ/EryC1/StrS family aminotransferase [Undibacterium sp.]